MSPARWDDFGPVVETIARPSSGGGQALSVDPERIGELRRRLATLVDTVATVRDDLQAIRVAAPGNDPVSRNAAMQAGSMMEASHVYVESWLKSLTAAILALDRQVDSYQNADEVASYKR
jgi:hypothetical protein